MSAPNIINPPAGGGGGTPVGGSGSSPYVAKWSGTSTLTTGILVDTGSSVGILTTSPVTTFQVGGNTVATPSPVGAFCTLGSNSRFTADDGTRAVTLAANGTDAIVGTTTAHDLVLQRGGAEAARIITGGLIGVGCTDPANTLETYASGASGIRASSDTQANIGIFQNSANPTGASLTLRKARGFRAAPSHVNSGDTIGTVQFSAYAMGNHAVSSIAANVVTYTSATDISSNLTFGTSPSGSAAAVTRMTIDQAGSVGIGTASPLTRLDVAGSGRITGAASSVLTGTADPTASTTLVGTGTAFNTELVIGDRITINAETRTVTAIASATSLTVDVAFTDTASASVTKLPAILTTRLSSNAIGLVQNNLGNVGIGTASPVAPMHVLGASQTGASIASSNPGILRIGGSVPNVLFVGSISDGAFGMYLQTNGSSPYPIVLQPAGGNVGIGTASPISPLEVKGNATNTDGILTLTPNSGGRSHQVQSLQASSLFRIYDQSAGASRLEIDISGNVKAVTTAAVFDASTAGAGLKLPATPGNTDPNTLDAYADGGTANSGGVTWTPALRFGGATTGITGSQVGRYTRIGNMVFAQGTIALSSKGAATGAATIAGLPTSANVAATLYYSIAIGYNSNVTFTGQLHGLISVNSGIVELYQTSTAGVVSAITNTDFAADSVLTFSVCYPVT